MSAALDAPHGPGSEPKGYLGTDHTQGSPEQPEIAREDSIPHNRRVHKVFVHMLGRIDAGGDEGVYITLILLVIPCRACLGMDHERWQHNAMSQ